MALCSLRILHRQGLVSSKLSYDNLEMKRAAELRKLPKIKGSLSFGCCFFWLLFLGFLVVFFLLCVCVFVMDYIREGEKKTALIMVKTTIYCTAVHWSTCMKQRGKTLSLFHKYPKIFPALTWGAPFFTKSYVKSCNLLHTTFFCPWAKSHSFSLNSIQISFPRMCIMCKQAEAEAVLLLAHYRCVWMYKYIHFILDT